MAGMKSKLSGRIANPIETATNVGGDFIAKTTSAVSDQFSGISDDFFSQLLGLDFGDPKPGKKHSSKGEMKAGEVIDLTEITLEARFNKQPSKPERRPDVLPGIDYRNEIVHGRERLSRTEARELDNQIKEIVTELKRIVSSSTTLSMEFAQISVESAPVQAGKYHLNFFSKFFCFNFVRANSVINNLSTCFWIKYS
jgi:hypothetical protein